MVRRIRWALLLAVILLLRAPTAAEAHTAFLSSTPAEGSRLTYSPRQIRLVFSEPLESSLARIYLVSADSQHIALTVASDPHDVHALVAPVANLAAGGYRIAWRVVSADGHPVSGTIDFSVGGAAVPVAAAEVDEAPAAWGPALWRAPMIPALLRGLAVGALMTLAGLLGFISYAPRRDGGTPAHSSRLAARLAVVAAVLLALHLAAWLANAAPDHQLSGDALIEIAATRVGQVELWRAAFGVLALWALLLARRELLALFFAVAALIVSGASGHSAAIVPAVAVPAHGIHLLAAAAWLGGVLHLLTVEIDDAEVVIRETNHVSSVALIAVVVVALSGVVQTLLFLPSLADLVQSAYGRIVCAKVAGLLVLVAFGAHYRSRVLPRLTAAGTVARFRGTLRYEMAVMSLVVLLGGLLAYVPPPMHDSPTPMSSHHDMP